MSLSPDHALIEANANTDAWREYYHQRIREAVWDDTDDGSPCVVCS